MRRNVFPRPLGPEEELPEFALVSPVEGVELAEGGAVGAGVGFTGAGPVAGAGFPNAGLVGSAPGFASDVPLVPKVGGVVTGGAIVTGDALVIGGELGVGALITGGAGIEPVGGLVPKPLSIFVPVNTTPHRGQLVYGLIGVVLVPSEAPHFSHDHDHTLPLPVPGIVGKPGGRAGIPGIPVPGGRIGKPGGRPGCALPGEIKNASASKDPMPTIANRTRKDDGLGM